MGDITDPVLRPLSIGEIFDRAVTLLIRKWVPFSIIGAIGVVPSTVTDYLAATQSPSWMLLSDLFSLLFSVAMMATVIVVAQIYRKEEIDWRGAVVRGLGRIPAMIGIGLMILFIFVMPLLIVVGIPAGLGVFKFPNPAADVVAVLSGLAGVTLLLGAIFAGNYAVAAMGVGGYGAMDSVGRALMLFGRGLAGRTLVFALAQSAIVLGSAFMGGVLVGFSTSVHSVALGTALQALVLFAGTLFGNVLIGVFYFDVAIRREGYDIQVALDAMPS
jgi:hypothetical protein